MQNGGRLQWLFCQFTGANLPQRRSPRACLLIQIPRSRPQLANNLEPTMETSAIKDEQCTVSFEAPPTARLLLKLRLILIKLIKLIKYDVNFKFVTFYFFGHIWL